MFVQFAGFMKKTPCDANFHFILSLSLEVEFGIVLTLLMILIRESVFHCFVGVIKPLTLTFFSIQ